MTSQCLTNEIRAQYSLGNGIVEFVERLAKKAQQWGETFATPIRKTTVAEEMGRDTRTVTRYLGQLEELGLVSTEAKRGRNGGTVVVFNTDILNFEPTDNPITSETKEAKEIRERVFPKAPTPKPKRRYRTKLEIAEARILEQKQKSFEERLNDLLERTFLDRDFFDNFEEPRLYFQGYLIAQMYNAYAVIFPKNRHEFFKDIDVKKSEEGLRSMNKAKSYNVLPARFVGTPQYNKFVEVARYCNENNINPLSYLTVQFERAEHLADIGKARVGAIPYVNTLLCEEARKAYSDNVMFYRKMRNSFNLFGISSSSVPYKGAKYEIIVALRTAYELDRTTRDTFNYLLDELASGAQQSVKQATLLGYYNTTLNALSESELVDEDQQLIRDFLKEQVLLYSRKNSLSSTIYALAFPLQINAVNSVATLKGLDKEMYYTYIGNMYKVTDVNDDEYNSFTERGRTIDFSYNANDTFFSTMRLIADCKGLGVPAGKLGSALQKFGEEKVPLDTFGMLDIERIYDKLIDSDELAKDRYIQDKDATMMSMVVTDEG